MGREGRIRNTFLNAVPLLFTSAAILVSGISCTVPVCTDAEEDNLETVVIRLSAGEYGTRAFEPDEDLVDDISIIIFDSNGDAEYSNWSDGKSRNGEDPEFEVTLVKGREYTFCACVNFDYQVCADTFEELSSLRHHLAYPDEYQEGMPMYAYERVTIGDNPVITLGLKRLMAKISVRMDRSRLSDDVKMDVISVRIGNCPKQVRVFGQSKVETGDGCFSAGFTRSDGECSVLNRNVSKGVSGWLSLYMLENMQGDFASGDIEDCEKVFDADDPRIYTCSYIEMELEYLSGSRYSYGSNLIYRFYLGDSAENLDVERNCHYRITVTPEDDGLSDAGWRVDKSSLYPLGEPYIKGYPASYINGDIGDTVHIWCDVSPLFAPFDVGTGYMEEDRRTGLYDYVVDEDGFGATLTLTGSGRGLIYMEAGEPVNDAALFIIEVNLPDSGQYETLYNPSTAPEYRQTQDVRRHLLPPVRGQ